MRAYRRGLGGTCSILLAITLGPAHPSAAPAGAEAGSDLTVTLVAKSASPLAQGLPFEFITKVRNGGAKWASGAAVLEIAPDTAPHAAVPFVSEPFLLGPGHEAVFRNDISTPQYFAQTGVFEISPFIDRELAGDPIRFEVGPPTATPVTFEDVTGDAGVGATLPDTSCDGQQTAGAAWADFDGDRDLDLYLPLPDQDARLFVNDGSGRFADRARSVGVTNSGSIGRAAVAADYDNDGDQDIYVLNEGPNRLYRNDGSSFADVTAQAGVGDDRLGTSASWGDYDNDGLLDLYVTNYADCAGVAHPDVLYHNEGDGTFTDQTAVLENGPGCDDGCTTGYGFQAAWFDYDGDRDLDLYLANDWNKTLPDPDRNHLWRNDGAGAFTDVTEQAEAAPKNLQSMGIGIGDLDGDLDLDLAISDIWGNAALRNDGDGTFTEVADAANLDRPWESAGVAAITWGLDFRDFDLDGWEDLYVASGSLFPGEGHQDPRYNQLFVNLGGGTGRFADLSALSGADSGAKSRGVAFADYDRDGRVDLYVVNQDGSPVLYRNTTPTAGRHWLEVDPVGRRSNRDGCGATIIAKVGSRRLLRQVFCGSTSLGTGNDPYVHFGLGSARKVDRLTILWPSGRRQVRDDVAVDRAIRITEPG